MKISSADIRERLTTDEARAVLDRLAAFEPLVWDLSIDRLLALSANLDVKDGNILSGVCAFLEAKATLDSAVVFYEANLLLDMGQGTLPGRRAVMNARGPGRREFSYSWGERRWKEVPPVPEEAIRDDRRWTRIATQMPAPYELVWLATEGGRDEDVIEGHSDGERWRTDGIDDKHHKCPWTHWMPREPAPKPPVA